MDQNQIPSTWSAKNLVISDASENEIDELQFVYDNCSYIGEWTGLVSKDEHPMLTEFEHKNLPPNGVAENHRLQSIKLKESNKIVGYFVLYHGFPEEKTFWIAVLAIHKDYQGKKFGQEVVKQLIEEVKNLNSYKNIGLTVGLKNWPAIRFWFGVGFNKIIAFKGDKTYSGKTFADLWLGQDI